MMGTNGWTMLVTFGIKTEKKKTKENKTPVNKEAGGREENRK
jgi:hypothetical protein